MRPLHPDRSIRSANLSTRASCWLRVAAFTVGMIRLGFRVFTH
jgi:hypothetical protein